MGPSEDREIKSVAAPGQRLTSAVGRGGAWGRQNAVIDVAALIVFKCYPIRSTSLFRGG